MNKRLTSDFAANHSFVPDLCILDFTFYPFFCGVYPLTQVDS